MLAIEELVMVAGGGVGAVDGVLDDALAVISVVVDALMLLDEEDEPLGRRDELLPLLS